MQKYLLYGFIGYGLIITLLFVSKGCEKPQETDLSALEHTADSLRFVNSVLENENADWRSKFDGVTERLDRIDLHLVEIQERREEIENEFSERLDGLDRLSLDSLKQIALEK
jgi:hypothetical protein